MKKIAIAVTASLLLAANPAFAGSSTVGYTAGTGTNFGVTPMWLNEAA